MIVTYAPSILDVSGLVGAMHRNAAREKIARLEQQMAGMEQTMPPVKHHFAPGLYAREMLLPAGLLIVGKIHKHAHINTISFGHVTVYTEFGESELRGPLTFTSEVGTKRVVLAHADTLWTTYHVTEETDLDKIEDYVIAKSYDQLPQLAVERVMQIEGKEQ